MDAFVLGFFTYISKNVYHIKLILSSKVNTNANVIIHTKQPFLMMRNFVNTYKNSINYRNITHDKEYNVVEFTLITDEFIPPYIIYSDVETTLNNCV